jgi:quinoprotein glucose dehydrogenase
MANSSHGFGFCAIILLAVVMAVFGLPIAAGGVWLISLGGSWYYALAGLGLLLSACFLARRSMTGVWIYLVTFTGTLAWALWEAGLNVWAQVPRLLALSIILLLVLLAIPAMRGRKGPPQGALAAAAVGILSLGSAALDLTTVRQTELVAQETPALAPVEAPQEAPAQPQTPPPLLPQAMEPALAAPPQAPAEPPAPTFVAFETGADWPAYGGTHGARRYSLLTCPTTYLC